MPDTSTTIERAFELARSGDYQSVNEVRQQLKREGRDDVGAELRTPATNRELIEVLRVANA